MAKRKYRKSKSSSSSNDAMAKIVMYLFAWPFIAMFYMCKGFVWLCKKFYGSNLSWKAKLGGTAGVLAFVVIAGAVGGASEGSNGTGKPSEIETKNSVKDVVERNIVVEDPCML